MESDEIKGLLEIRRVVEAIVEHGRDKDRIDRQISDMVFEISKIVDDYKIPPKFFDGEFWKEIMTVKNSRREFSTQYLIGDNIPKAFSKFNNEFPAILGSLINGLWVDERKKSKASVATGSLK